MIIFGIINGCYNNNTVVRISYWWVTTWVSIALTDICVYLVQDVFTSRRLGNNLLQRKGKYYIISEVIKESITLSPIYARLNLTTSVRVSVVASNQKSCLPKYSTRIRTSKGNIQVSRMSYSATSNRVINKYIAR
jgi:hypothetical protein